MNTISVPVKSAFASKINWISGLTAAVATLNETTDALQQLLPVVPPKYQHYITVGIVVLGGLANIITRTWFTSSVTQASANKVGN